MPRSSPPQPDTETVARLLLDGKGLAVTSCREIQQLWAGYGHICAVTAESAVEGAKRKRKHNLILKLIAPPPSDGKDEGHLRKMLSYDVEQYFYEHVAPTLLPTVPVAQCVASSTRRSPLSDALKDVTAMVLTDLRDEFPVAGGKREFLNAAQVNAAIDWLAGFHAASLSAAFKLDEYVLPPLEEAAQSRGERKLWRNGGYTYLATRRTEYASLAEEGSELGDAFCRPSDTGLSIAEMVAAFLTPQGRHMESLIHGDVKSENMFSTTTGDRVAFYDFQYVGVGLGVCDLAKLFTCSVPLSVLGLKGPIPHTLGLGDGEVALLERYHDSLLQRTDYPWDELLRHWETALVDWCRFQASWGFWGNEEWLKARVRHILSDDVWNKWLREVVKT